MKRISLLACAIAGIVAFAHIAAQAQTPVEGNACDKCKHIKEQCDKETDTNAKRICNSNYMQSCSGGRCPK